MSWKVHQLVLIRKGKGDPTIPPGYRPVCMVDTAVKLVERMLKSRLERRIERVRDLSIHFTIRVVSE